MLSWYDDEKVHAQASRIAQETNASKQVTFGRLLRAGIDLNPTMEQVKAHLAEERMAAVDALAASGDDEDARVARQRRRAYILYPPDDLDAVRWIRQAIEDRLGRPINAPVPGEFAGEEGWEVLPLGEADIPPWQDGEPLVDDDTVVLDLGDVPENGVDARLVLPAGDVSWGVRVFPEARQVFLAADEATEAFCYRPALRGWGGSFLAFGSPGSSAVAMFGASEMLVVMRYSEDGEIRERVARAPYAYGDGQAFVVRFADRAVRLAPSGISLHRLADTVRVEGMLGSVAWRGSSVVFGEKGSSTVGER